MSLRSVFIDNIKFYRKKAKLSQQKLAERCDIATNYLSEIETGKKFPSIEVIETLADALSISAYLLFIDTSDIAVDSESIVQKRNEGFSKEIIKSITDLLRKYEFLKEK